jgi:hypothetical protein
VSTLRPCASSRASWVRLFQRSLAHRRPVRHDDAVPANGARPSARCSVGSTHQAWDRLISLASPSQLRQPRRSVDHFLAGLGIQPRGFSIFQISDSADCWVADVDTLAQIAPAVRSVTPGHYLVEEIRADDNPFPSGHHSRAWGTAIHHPDGRVALRQFHYRADVALPLDRIRVPRSLRRNYAYRTSNPWTHRVAWLG